MRNWQSPNAVDFIDWLFNWLIHFNGISNGLELFYTMRITNIVHLYLHLLCSFLRIFVFCTWLYNIKYSYLIQTICKQIYLTQWWNLQEVLSRRLWCRSNGNEEKLRTHRDLELEPHHSMKFSVIPQIFLFVGKGSYPSAGDTVSMF